MTYYTYSIFYCNEYDYARYMEGEVTIYSEIHIPKEEWKQIVSKAFKETLKMDRMSGLHEIIKYIAENDDRFITKENLLIPVGRSELWGPHWDNWNINRYDPDTMVMYKEEDENMHQATFLIP